ncbi:MAG: hypothetical protein HDR00_00745 [Lachnospiraceae bacterium]|nr:hypothetical protein [Lachnospiraceae bacterium]
MKKKYLFIIIISIFSLCSVIVLLMLRQNNHGFNDVEYIYDSTDPQCNYSEHNVLYLDDSGILHLIETTSGKDMVYCDRPNCTHEGFSHNNENPSCPAVFWGLSKSGTVLYNEHLYFIGNMSNEDGLLTQYLYEMDSNGENRKKVATLEGVQNLRYVLYRDKYVIGAYYNRSEINDEGQIINDNKPETGIFVINLNNYDVYMGDKITGEQANITGIYYEEGAVYYSIIRFDDDVTELMLEDAAENNAEFFDYDNMLYEIYRYDIANKNTMLLKTFDHINNLQMLDGNAYYASQGGCFVVDKENGETKELAIDKDAGTLWGGFAKHEDALYYALFDSDSNEVTYYRMENDESDELMRMPSEDSFGIVNICGQSVYINYTDDKGRFCLGVLSIDDLDQGKFRARELRCYDEEK